MAAAAKATERDLLICQQPARTLAPPNRATFNAGSSVFCNSHLTTPVPPLISVEWAAGIAIPSTNSAARRERSRFTEFCRLSYHALLNPDCGESTAVGP